MMLMKLIGLQQIPFKEFCNRYHPNLVKCVVLTPLGRDGLQKLEAFQVWKMYFLYIAFINMFEKN